MSKVPFNRNPFIQLIIKYKRKSQKTRENIHKRRDVTNIKHLGSLNISRKEIMITDSI